MKLTHTLITLAVLTTLTACSNNADNNPQVDALPDLSEDVSPDTRKDMRKDEACQPITECPADTCGRIDDGCGGRLDCGEAQTCADIGVCGQQPDGCGQMLDCGECLCDNGQPTKPACDACGVFALECDAQDQSSCSGLATTPQVLGLTDADCLTAIVYVDQDNAQAGNGTQANPFSDLEQALDAVRARQAGQVKAIVIASSPTFEGTFELIDGVSILGGYNTSFSPDSSQRPILRGESTADGVFGVRGENIDEPTLLRNLDITTADASTGQHVYGMHLIDSQGIRLQRGINVQASKGGDGSDGGPGVPGFPVDAQELLANAVSLKGKDGYQGELTAIEDKRRPLPNGALSWEVIKTRSALRTNNGTNPNCSDSKAGKGGEGTYQALGAQENPAIQAEDGYVSEQGTLGGDGATKTIRVGSNGKNGAGINSVADTGQNGASNLNVTGFPVLCKQWRRTDRYYRCQRPRRRRWRRRVLPHRRMF